MIIATVVRIVGHNYHWVHKRGTGTVSVVTSNIIMYIRYNNIHACSNTIIVGFVCMSPVGNMYVTGYKGSLNPYDIKWG